MVRTSIFRSPEARRTVLAEPAGRGLGGRSSSRRAWPLALVVFATSLAGCNVFHYSDIPTGKGNEPDAETGPFDSGPEGAPEEDVGQEASIDSPPDGLADAGCVELVNDCEGPVGVIDRDKAPLCLPPTVTLSKVPSLSCLQTGPGQPSSHFRPNPDAFFGVQMAKGDRWHFHFTPNSSVIDVSLAVLGDCSELHCQTGIDRCPAGSQEHMTFVPDSAGTYYVSVNGLAGDISRVQIDAYKLKSPPCNGTINPDTGMLNHGESCTPVAEGGVQSGSCDDKCRAILLPDAQKDYEPNNDPFSANVIRMPNGDFGTSRVNGTIDSQCTNALDMMAVKVPSGATLTATLAAPVVCPLLTIVDEAYTAQAITDTSTPCATAKFVSMTDREYYLQIAPNWPTMAYANVQYTLTVQVSPPMTPDQ